MATTSTAVTVVGRQAVATMEACSQAAGAKEIHAIGGMVVDAGVSQVAPTALFQSMQTVETTVEVEPGEGVQSHRHSQRQHSIKDVLVVLAAHRRDLALSSRPHVMVIDAPIDAWWASTSKLG